VLDGLEDCYGAQGKGRRDDLLEKMEARAKSIRAKNAEAIAAH
jgi:hypothetical protein